MLFDLSSNVILGQGKTAIATAEYLLKHQHPFQIYSLKPNQLPKHLEQYYTNTLGDYSMAWLSPGIPEGDVLLKGIQNAWLDVDYFLHHYQGSVVVVTGTNGKSTVSCMVRDMLRELGYQAECYGNYQPGLLSALDQPLDWVVIELSSYQLSRIQCPAKVAASVLLNITPDHIDWHGNFESYKAVKLKIHTLANINVGIGGIDFQYRVPMLTAYHLQDALNLAAAMEVLHQLGFVPPELPQLPQLPYRQAIVSYQGKIVINDSKSTNIASTVSALQTTLARYPDKSIMLILAGIEKDRQYETLIPLLYRVKTLVVGNEFADLSPYIDKRYSCIQDAISCMIEHDGVILFSPGGASYDQYGNYEERGEDFSRCFFPERTS